VAEGVEDSQTAEMLREMGCRLAQGYLYSPALGLESLERWEELQCSVSPKQGHVDAMGGACSEGVSRARPA
jgi:sensor c-di-GMP phosphodiesterase-like protein